MLKKVDFALQPIVEINSGALYAVEALFRGYQELGFRSIDSFFDHHYLQRDLYRVDLALRKKALKKFKKIPEYKKYKLFYNIDNRIFLMHDFNAGNTTALLHSLGLRRENICFEISEKHRISEDSGLEVLLAHYAKEHIQVAIDDFGQGYAGYKLLYDILPNFIKIDRFFLQGIKEDYKKRTIVRSIVQLAAQFGIRTIAEGIETEEEFLTSKELGCQYAQGYFIQRPTLDVKDILPHYEHIAHISRKDRRKQSKIEPYIKKIPTLYYQDRIERAIAILKEQKARDIAVLNSLDEPIGIIDIERLSPYLYSPYGFSLLKNEESKLSKMDSFLQPIPSVDLHAKSEDILTLYASMQQNSGILVTKESKYYGYLTPEALLKLIHQERLLLAQDQNPLTHLPGNRLIDAKIQNLLEEKKEFVLCYFDFNNFKAYNDHYGFRQGDRVIWLFAQILRKRLADIFLGHIGGDDFICIAQEEFDTIFQRVRKAIEEFECDVLSFYSQEDRQRGYIEAFDRDGVKKRFDFLQVSCAFLSIVAFSKERSLNSINALMAKMKKTSKSAEPPICAACML